MSAYVIESDSDTDYPEDLYRFDQPATYVDTVADIGPDELARYRRDGYLAVRQLFEPTEIADILAGFAAVLDDPGDVMVQYEAWAKDRISSATGVERMDLIRKFMWFVKADPRLQAAAENDLLVSVVQRLTGSADVTMFQDMALLKPPGGGREKPWHQDNAFFAYEPGTPIVGVWIALDEATADNGCMHVMPGTHREGPRLHFMRRDWQLCDTDVQRARDVVVPLPPGGALFFDGLIHHGTPANRTDTRRRAVQFHYMPVGMPQVPEERRLEIFGSEGKDVTC